MDDTTVLAAQLPAKFKAGTARAPAPKCFHRLVPAQCKHAHDLACSARSGGFGRDHAAVGVALTHELGHAFGMDHMSYSTDTALMNPRLSDDGSVPTRLDVAAFVATLERSITDAAPGALEFRASEGLLAPKDWMPTSRHSAGRASSLQ